MKELWIEIDESLSEDVKNDLLKSVAQLCDAVVVGAKDLENAKKTGTKIAASSGECDINLLEASDEDRLRELKGRKELLP